MFEPSVLFDQLDRRARMVRGLHYAGIFSACVAASALLAAILSAALALPITHFVLIAASSVIVLGGAGFTLGIRLPYPRSVILMRADVVLGLEATLSTLNDIQGKPEMELFSKRIEARLPAESPPSSRAFPIHWREAGFAASAVVLLIAAIVVTIIPTRNRQNELPSTVATEATIEESDSHLIAEVANQVVRENQDETESPRDASNSESTETLTLGDILTSIRSTPAAVTASNNEMDEATLRPRQPLRLSLEDVLRQIEAKLLGDESQSLSILEKETLVTHRESAQGEIAERLERILESSSPDEILEQVSQILANPELADAMQGTELPADEQGSIQAVKVGSNVETESPPLMLDPSADPESQLVFVETTLPSASGEDGDYTYYLTKGVPIEPPAEATELSYQDLDLSYEQLDSIASSRSLDPDVLDTIKAYFDRIARGGS